MRYVTVTGETHVEALQILRDNYGEDAWIYSEKEVPASSVLGRLFGRKEYQIDAGIPEKKPRTGVKKQINDLEQMFMPVDAKQKNDELWKQAKAPIKSFTSGQKQDLSLIKKDFLKTVQKELQARPQLLEGKKSSHQLDRLGQDVDIIKNKLSVLAAPKNDLFLEKELQKLFEVLQEQEFSLHWAKSFVEQVRNDLPKNDWSDKRKIYQKALWFMEKKVPIAQSAVSKKVMVLLGATGVGKTTTLSKLAARMQLQEDKKVTVATLDNSRIAATEQLRLFTEILEIPMKVFNAPKKFHLFVEQDNSDLILVDTNGFSQHNKEQLEQQRDFFSSARSDAFGNVDSGISKKIEKHLVLSAATRAKDVKSIIENFQEQNIHKIILTKLDESSYYGAFVELAESKKLPFSFFTFGQAVPQDQRIADGEYLAKKILQSYQQK